MTRPGVRRCLLASLVAGATATVAAQILWLVADFAANLVSHPEIIRGDDVHLVGTLTLVFGFAAALVIGFPSMLLFRLLGILTRATVISTATIVGALMPLLVIQLLVGQVPSRSGTHFALGFFTVFGSAVGAISGYVAHRVLRKNPESSPGPSSAA